MINSISRLADLGLLSLLKCEYGGIVMLSYGDKRNYRKIDLFYDGAYICSTTRSRTCREAKAALLENNGSYGHQKVVQLFGKVDPSKIVAHFSK